MNRNFEQAQGVQRRTMAAELRASENGPDFLIEGYAATFNKVSQDLGGFREVIKPGAFSRTIAAGTDIVCLANHSPLTGVLGRCSAGTLKVSEDSKGLRYSCQLDKNQQSHRDLWSSIKRGDTRYCSFAFTIPDGGQQWEDGIDPDSGEPCAWRTLTDVDLIDVSPVCYPAYDGTAVSARAAEARAHGQQAGPSADSVAKFRRAAQLMGPKFEIRTEGDEMALCREHLRMANEFLEAAYSFSDTADQIMNVLDDDDDPDDDRSKRESPYPDPYSYRNFRAAHKEVHAQMEKCCHALARCRLMQPAPKK